MCQAIVKPAGYVIEDAILRRAWESNPDGGGFAVRLPDGRIEIRKGFHKFKKFLKQYRHFSHLDCLIHFRYATHGEDFLDNCHPFPLGDHGAIMHNGILSRFLPSPLDKRSDTRVLIEDYLTPSWKASGLTIHAFLSLPATRVLFEALIGAGNKLAALTTEGFHLFNEQAGEWKEGCWYSSGYPHKYEYPFGYRLSGSAGSMSGGYGYAYDDDQVWQRAYEAWGELRDDEEDPYTEPESEPEFVGCTLCGHTNVRLYQVGTDTLCDPCWYEYTKPCNAVVRRIQ